MVFALDASGSHVRRDHALPPPDSLLAAARARQLGGLAPAPRTDAAVPESVRVGVLGPGQGRASSLTVTDCLPAGWVAQVSCHQNADDTVEGGTPDGVCSTADAAAAFSG